MNPPLARIEVLIDHPLASGYIPLEKWIEIGPGLRVFIEPRKARDQETGLELPLSVVPLQYRNHQLSQFLIEEGLLADPWSHLAYKLGTRDSSSTGDQMSGRGMDASRFLPFCKPGSSALDVAPLAALTYSCDFGTVAAVESCKEKLGGRKKTYRLFCQQSGIDEWCEIPLVLQSRALPLRISGGWPPENILKMTWDDSGLRLIFIDALVSKRPARWIYESRLDYETGKWAVRKIVDAGEYRDHPALAGASRSLSRDELDLLEENFGRPR